MNTEDCKFATEFGGECWHDKYDSPYGIRCAKCKQAPLLKPRTFTTPDDVYFLIGALKKKGYAPIGFRHWLSSNGYPILLDFMFIYTPAEQCQLIVDFLKETPHDR